MACDFVLRWPKLDSPQSAAPPISQESKADQTETVTLSSALLLSLFPIRANVTNKAVPVGHPYLWQRCRIHDIGRANDFVQVEKIRSQGVHLICGQRPHSISRLGAIKVVPNGGGIRPETTDRFHRFFGGECAPAADKDIKVAASARFAMTARTFCSVDRRSLLC